MPTVYKQDWDSDCLLLKQLSDGNRFAFDALYKKYWSFVFNNAYKRLHDVALAEDVTQDVFTQLWHHTSEQEIKDLPGYLFISTRNRVIRLMERERRYQLVPDLLEHLKGLSESADAALLYQELKLTYETLIANLTEQQQLIFRLRYVDNFSAVQIAERLNLSPKTVRNQLGKISHKIRAAMFMIPVLWLYFLWLQ